MSCCLRGGPELLLWLSETGLHAWRHYPAIWNSQDMKSKRISFLIAAAGTSPSSHAFSGLPTHVKPSLVPAPHHGIGVVLTCASGCDKQVASGFVGWRIPQKSCFHNGHVRLSEATAALAFVRSLPNGASQRGIFCLPTKALGRSEEFCHCASPVLGAFTFAVRNNVRALARIVLATGLSPQAAET